MAKKTRSRCSIDIAQAQSTLARFAPFSTSSEYPIWKDLMDSLTEVRAALDLVDAYKPGIIDTLVAAAYEEACVRKDPPPDAIAALIERYTTRPVRR